MPSPYSKRNEERLLAWLVHSALRERATAKLGFHASHEQFPPSELLALMRATEMAGFDCGMSIGPLSPVGICSGPVGVCVVLAGSGPQATSLPFGVISAPGYRYHPAIIAQGAATLAEMFPGRFWLWTGKRSAAEDITGLPWPEEVERNARLSECASTVAALLRGETVSHSGRVTA
jgi:coenzyme F420-dependent glucose-6-phosphate dehydrogenase